MGFIKRIFAGSERKKARTSASAAMAAEDLRRIERELERIGTGRGAARLLNRAGDLYLLQEDGENALRRYGLAIDDYLQAGEYDNAMAVCRKIIRMVPEVIRTRRTLAWLCLGKGFLEIAREHIEAYVEASLEAGLQSLAVQQLQLMAQYVDRSDFREFLAGRLTDLGDEDAAKRVRIGEAIDSVREAGWATVVFAAMLTPEDLRQAASEGVDIVAPAADEPGVDGLDRYFVEVDDGVDDDDDEEVDEEVDADVEVERSEKAAPAELNDFFVNPGPEEEAEETGAFAAETTTWQEADEAESDSWRAEAAIEAEGSNPGVGVAEDAATVEEAVEVDVEVADETDPGGDASEGAEAKVDIDVEGEGGSSADGGDPAEVSGAGATKAKAEKSKQKSKKRSKKKSKKKKKKREKN